MINLRFKFSEYVFLLFVMQLGACSSMPDLHHQQYRFPEKDIFIELPTGSLEKKPYEVLGWVKAKSKFASLDMDHNDAALCRNYYNKAAAELIREAKKAGADVVIKVRSVVLLLDGKIEEHPTPECSDDGAEGEILLKGIAIRFRKDTEKPTLAP